MNVVLLHCESLHLRLSTYSTSLRWQSGNQVRPAGGFGPPISMRSSFIGNSTGPLLTRVKPVTSVCTRDPNPRDSSLSEPLPFNPVLP